MRKIRGRTACSESPGRWEPGGAAAASGPQRAKRNTAQPWSERRRVGRRYLAQDVLASVEVGAFGVKQGGTAGFIPVLEEIQGQVFCFSEKGEKDGRQFYII